MPRVTGIVKWFSDLKRKPDGTDGGGYGFLLSDSGEEYFVHRTDLGRSCLQKISDRAALTLLPGQKVTFEAESSTKGNGKKATAVELAS